MRNTDHGTLTTTSAFLVYRVLTHCDFAAYQTFHDGTVAVALPGNERQPLQRPARHGKSTPSDVIRTQRRRRHAPVDRVRICVLGDQVGSRVARRRRPVPVERATVQRKHGASRPDDGLPPDVARRLQPHVRRIQRVEAHDDGRPPGPFSRHRDGPVAGEDAPRDDGRTGRGVFFDIQSAGGRESSDGAKRPTHLRPTDLSLIHI